MSVRFLHLPPSNFTNFHDWGLGGVVCLRRLLGPKSLDWRVILFFGHFLVPNSRPVRKNRKKPTFQKIDFFAKTTQVVLFMRKSAKIAKIENFCRLRAKTTSPRYQNQGCNKLGVEILDFGPQKIQFLTTLNQVVAPKWPFQKGTKSLAWLLSLSQLGPSRSIRILLDQFL